MKSFQASCIFLTLVTAESVIRRQTNVAFDTTSGFGPGALPLTGEYEALFAAAGRTPNISTSVSFSYGSPAEEWIWRLNITDVSLDDDLVATNLQCDLQWPGGETLQSYLDDREGTGSGNPALNEEPLCAGTWSWAVQANISSLYSGDDNGSCTNILGEQCAASFLAAVEEGQCGSSQSSSSLSGLAGCEDTFDVGKSGGGSAFGMLMIFSSYTHVADSKNDSSGQLDRDDYHLCKRITCVGRCHLLRHVPTGASFERLKLRKCADSIEHVVSRRRISAGRLD